MTKREIELIKEFAAGFAVLALGGLLFWLLLHVYSAITGHYMDFGGSNG